MDASLSISSPAYDYSIAILTMTNDTSSLNEFRLFRLHERNSHTHFRSHFTTEKIRQNTRKLRENCTYGQTNTHTNVSAQNKRIYIRNRPVTDTFRWHGEISMLTKIFFQENWFKTSIKIKLYHWSLNTYYNDQPCCLGQVVLIKSGSE